MQTARRLYLYLMSGITLGVLLVGLNILLTVVLHAIGVGRGAFAGGSQNDREQLSLAGALIVVGLVVWSIHWVFIERGLWSSNPAHDKERASGLRALYFTVVLAVLLVLGTLAGIQLLQEVMRAILGVEAADGFGFGGFDLGATLATLLVTGLAWTYHAVIRRRDLDAGPLVGAAAWIPRVYLYGAAAVGLVLTALSISGLLGTALGALLGELPEFAEGDFRRRMAADAIAGVIGWGVIWLGHWWYATSLMRDTRWRGLSERRARLRLAYLVAAVVASAIGVITYGTQALGAGLGLALGADILDGAPNAAAAIAVPLISMVPWALAWVIHWRWMRAESLEADGAGWIAAVDRLEAAALALVGLAAGAGGIGGMLGLLIDVVLGGNRTDTNFWREELATYLAIGFIGSVIWLWNWAHLESRRAAEPVVEAGSTIRRSYLLIVVAVALIISLGSVAFLLYRLFGTILEVQQFDNTGSALSPALGALVVAAMLALYHGLAVRRDQALRAVAAAAEPEVVAETEAIAPAEVVTPMQRVLVLSGPPTADLDATVAAMRAALAPELRLEDAPSPD